MDKRMHLPAVLLRHSKNVYKNNFGRVFVLAGSQNMLGAGALTSLSAMRAGAGLVTLGVPQSLNPIAQKKISNVVMTLPLKETSSKTVSLSAFTQIQDFIKRCQALAIGPGLSTHPSTQKLCLRIIKEIDTPMVIDADGLNNIVGHLDILREKNSEKILTPHPGEMARLLNIKPNAVEKNRKTVAINFAKKYQCVVILKGHQSIVASPSGPYFMNSTGNAGMATAGSGDVLTGIIVAFLAQGLKAFEAAKFGVYIHGLAGDLAAKHKTKVGMIATDIIDSLAATFKKLGARGA
jgi:hydroxyethylthiazole kinase-like uncharacterized protein yjeF